MLDRLEAMLASGQDSASLRFALATGYLKQSDPERAVAHAKVAVAQDPDYSAAWRLLGQAQVAAGSTDEAVASFERGIAVARQRGDRQVEKEMQVFLRRLQKGRSNSG